MKRAQTAASPDMEPNPRYGLAVIAAIIYPNGEQNTELFVNGVYYDVPVGSIVNVWTYADPTNHPGFGFVR